MPDTIFLFTDRYPYGAGETFVDTELKADVASKYDICIVPVRAGRTKRELPSGAMLCEDVVRAPLLLKCTAWLRMVASRHLWSLPFVHNYPPRGLRQWKNAIGGLYRANLLYMVIKSNRDFFSQADVMYSYWFDNTALGLSIAKEHIDELEDIPIVCRAHGFDVFEEERGIYFPSRGYVFSHIEKVLAVSKKGADYLRSRYPEGTTHIGNMYLGVKDAAARTHELVPGRLSFVSCSNMIPLKRLEITADFIKRYAAENPSTEISWTHFGQGPSCGQVKKAVSSDKPSNLNVFLEGPVENDELLRRYAGGTFDIFVSMSRMEGMPVSVMEAMSCGIVPLCADAGGTSEAVDGTVGALIPNSPSYDDFRSAANRIAKNYVTLSQAALDRQRKMFSMQSNFAAFYRYLSRIKSR